MKKIGKNTFIAALLLVGSSMVVSCARSAGQEQVAINVQIVDRNGVMETISDPERIRMIEKTNFLEPQPYQRVSRVYEKNIEGKVPGKLLVYHNNGLPWQYLETLGGRANGLYKEWHPNGTLRMKAHILEGMGDLSSEAHLTWIFDRESEVFSDKGERIAQIFYDKGLLTKESIYYYPSGAVMKSVPYEGNKVHGIVKTFAEDGTLLGETAYIDGVKEGRSFFEGDQKRPKREEFFEKGLLVRGEYTDFSGAVIFEVVDGYGTRPTYEEGRLIMTHEYRAGRPEGEVRSFRKGGGLESVYFLRDGVKDGEEWCYYDSPSGEDKNPMLFIDWKDDEIHGRVRTWYPNGVLESEKEMSHNKKDGSLLAWYEDGSLMMVEQYEDDTLVSGKYLKRGEEMPVSRVVSGEGIATIYDSRGRFLRKISYQKGIPLDKKG